MKWLASSSRINNYDYANGFENLILASRQHGLDFRGFSYMSLAERCEPSLCCIYTTFKDGDTICSLGSRVAGSKKVTLL